MIQFFNWPDKFSLEKYIREPKTHTVHDCEEHLPLYSFAYLTP